MFFAAFTMFSACEYVIAVANILFHFTAVHEFGEASWCLLDASITNRRDLSRCHVSGDGGHMNGPILCGRIVTDYDNNKKFS